MNTISFTVCLRDFEPTSYCMLNMCFIDRNHNSCSQPPKLQVVLGFNGDYSYINAKVPFFLKLRDTHFTCYSISSIFECKIFKMHRKPEKNKQSLRKWLLIFSELHYNKTCKIMLQFRIWKCAFLCIISLLLFSVKIRVPIKI